MPRLCRSLLAVVACLRCLPGLTAQTQTPEWVARQIRDRDAGRDSRAEMRMRLFDRQRRVRERSMTLHARFRVRAPQGLLLNPIPVHAFNPGPFTGAGNVTWLIPGSRPVLIDAGTGEARHLDALESALGAMRLATVLVTHAHVDHASGAPAIAERMPDARFAKMPWPERDAGYAVAWHSLADGDRIEAGDTTVMAVHTPGHAPDHLCF